MAITWTCLAMAIALGYKVMVAMALFGYANSSIKRLQDLFAHAMTFLFFINIIAPGSLLYMIPVSHS